MNPEPFPSILQSAENERRIERNREAELAAEHARVTFDLERICDLDYWRKRLNRKFGRKVIHHKPMRGDKV